MEGATYVHKYGGRGTAEATLAYQVQAKRNNPEIVTPIAGNIAPRSNAWQKQAAPRAPSSTLPLNN